MADKALIVKPEGRVGGWELAGESVTRAAHTHLWD